MNERIRMLLSAVKASAVGRVLIASMRIASLFPARKN